ncbi:cTPxI [Mucor circinelloides]
MVVAQVQKLAPDFDAPGVMNGQIVEHIKLSDYRGKYVVLFWYPLDFTFVCPTEIIAFNDAYEEFQSLDCQLIAASCDSEYAHHAWVSLPRQSGGLGEQTKIPIISDKTKAIAKSYGVYLSEEGVSLRGLFIIDPKGIVRQITMNDLQVGRSVTEIIRLVEAFQFTDKHGEVCPANWNKGSKTIIPDVEKAKAYFLDDDD